MQILTVSQAVSYLRELIESNLVLGDVWLSGEVSGPRTQPSGHTYFTIKDDAAQLRSVMFRATMQRQRRAADYLVQGTQVIVHGRLTVYEARGELQVVVDFVQPEGVGLRHAQFERLRAQLEEEGLFDASRKRALPAIPRRVGVVSSSAGAVFHDICNVLMRRWPLAEVVLAPTSVQGPEAASGIVGALGALNALSDIDVIIVARGGGSVEELWAFNEEPVARAVFGSLVPVVSAVGHETDFTICDYVADMRAPTPSAAAELVAPDRYDMAMRIRGRLGAGLSGLVGALSLNRSATAALLSRAERRAADTGRLRQRLDDFERRALGAVEGARRDRAAHLRRCLAQLAALDPNATLKRGYAVVHKGGSVVGSIGDVSGGDALVVKLTDGAFPARVDGPAQKRRPAQTNGRTHKDPAVQPVLFP